MFHTPVHKLTARQPSATDRYIDALQAHDWFFDYSDDHGVFRQGMEQRRQLDALAQELDPDYRIWDAYAPGQFRRAVFNTSH